MVISVRVLYNLIQRINGKISDEGDPSGALQGILDEILELETQVEISPQDVEILQQVGIKIEKQ